MKVKKKRTVIIFLALLLVIVGIFVYSVIKTNDFNEEIYYEKFNSEEIFTDVNDESKDVNINVVPRSGTWGKIFDFDNEGLTENNFTAYTYDFTISNNTKDQVDNFIFRLTFNTDAYLASAWNGALEIHQKTADGEYAKIVPDLREFNPNDYDFNIFTVDGEPFIVMKQGDYLVYHPSSSMNAMEIPIEAHEGTTPGIIMYVANGDSIEGSTIEMEYSFHRLLTSEPLFWVSIIASGVWFIALLIAIITSLQIKQYQVRHERDNKIINESIETFTGFIDAKDPYTNGHSKRVAYYTKLIAKECGYEGEELDRIYYVALLHDCGKIGVPDDILGKPGRLTSEEFEIIKSHTVRGGEILSSFKSLKDVGEGALYHHERYDGKGYPEGKKGEDIPLIARMICVADSFDAMNTDRVYRKKLSKEQIIDELEKNKGLQFDPVYADVMLKLIKENRINFD